MAGKWPEKNPESKYFPMLDSPLSTTAASKDPRPGIHENVPDDASPSNPMGFNSMGEGKGKKGRKR
jgi:hypothetical protein